MVNIENKCSTYEKEAQDALNILKRRKLIIILPTVLLIALSVVFAIFASVFCLAICLLGVL